MLPFVSIKDFLLFSNPIKLYCKDEGTHYIYTIPDSKIFILPEDNEKLISKVQRLSLADAKTIILYDKGDLLCAGKVYWALKAAGFENIFILLGGVLLYHDLGYQVNTDPIPEIELEEQSYLPFNNSVLKVLCEQKTKSGYYQKIRADEDLPITTPRGDLLETDVLNDIMKNSNIKYKSGKAIQVLGKYAPIIACVLLHIGENHVSVILDSLEKVDKSYYDDENAMGNLKAYSVHESSSYIDASTPIKPRKPKNRRAGTVCGNCCLF
ncbi:hypothetical protein SteCoe_14360 [Stentor coeruleus]|uniref:Rhodanese domain-containing protein n=1 Tax=Stentor coeruleus TaxID=5963 RepID=A0A1R2C635_9CILI|nr:hypothetical protein SteCoe_14360 [Stentor coeruleus]